MTAFSFRNPRREISDRSFWANSDHSASLTGAAGYAYTYDGDGNRVIKANGTTASSGTLYWYMMPGVVAESDLAGTLKSEYIFFDGERVARRDNPGSPSATVAYYFSDHLKTASVITDASGTIKADSDYYPWGGELQFVANDANDYKFTGKKRDAETGLDYFGARYYSNGLGRWVTPDWAAKATAVPYAEFSDPQSLNLYSYVRNIPTTKYDADGHCSSPSVGKGEVGICIDYYISTKTVDPHGLGKIGLGDNRETTGNDTQERFRVEVKLVVTRGKILTKISGTSQAGMSRTSVGLHAPGKEKTQLGASMDKAGNIHLDVKTTGINGFQAKGFPGAPKGAIQGDVKLVVTPDNKVGTDEGGARTAYPALEIYKYQQGQAPKQILNMPQSSDSNDLTKGMTQQIPKVPPQ